MSLPDGPILEEKKSNFQKGTALPREKQVSDTQSVESLDGVIRSAPLKTAATVQADALVEIDQSPWRNSTTISADELLAISKKVSLDMPLELDLRIQFLRDKKKKGIAKKPTTSSIIIEALEKYTRTELRRLGYEVD